MLPGSVVADRSIDIIVRSTNGSLGSQICDGGCFVEYLHCH